MTLSSSKQRTTWTMASVSRMLARNWLPRPSPLEAPSTRPAMSTNSMAVGTQLLRLDDGREHGEARVGHRDDADVRIDGAEWIVGRRDAGLGQGIEEGRFADVGQADDAAFQSHGFFLRRLCRATVAGRRHSRRRQFSARPAGSGPARVRYPAFLPCAAGAARNRRPAASSSRRVADAEAQAPEVRLPSRAWMSFRPLWPPLPPPCLRRMPPGGRSSSSCTTRISSGAIL